MAFNLDSGPALRATRYPVTPDEKGKGLEFYKGHSPLTVGRLAGVPGQTWP